jgi:hypothetical protein
MEFFMAIAYVQENKQKHVMPVGLGLKNGILPHLSHSVGQVSHMTNHKVKRLIFDSRSEKNAKLQGQKYGYRMGKLAPIMQWEGNVNSKRIYSWFIGK